MFENELEIKTLINNFIKEAEDAADMILSEINEWNVPYGVIEAVNETKSMINKVSLFKEISISVLVDINWEMHIVCSKLYLCIQKIPRDKRKPFDKAIKAYKSMLYNFSVGQAHFIDLSFEQGLKDIRYQAKILNEIVQNENIRFITNGKYINELKELLKRLDKVTQHLQLEKQDYILYDISSEFKSISIKMKYITEMIGEQADPINYIANEYSVFAVKIDELIDKNKSIIV